MTQKYEYFGKYVLLEKLATGGMAEVYLARAPSAGGIAKFFAIKRILPQFADSPEFIDMFKEEAKIAINLNHSNIVSIHEFGMQADQFYLVMDYVEGRNIRQILNKMKKSKQRFAIDQIVYIVKEVAAGLDHAHRCLDSSTGKPLNITHRDMSPQNVMISYEGEVRIVDFGIAKAESQIESTRAGTIKGKFGYMSPEQAEGQPVDLRTDIFSLGTVLWELLANDRLFLANNEVNTLRKIRECQVPSLRKINPNIHAELERIAEKALARDRNLRYQTAAALHRDLNRFLNRQYPDFSPQDFSVFVKTIFADEILSTRKRLIDYTKIPFKDSGLNIFDSSDKTIVSSSGIDLETMAEPISPDPNSGETYTGSDVNFGDNFSEEESVELDTTQPATDSTTLDPQFSGEPIGDPDATRIASPPPASEETVIDQNLESSLVTAIKKLNRSDKKDNPEPETVVEDFYSDIMNDHSLDDFEVVSKESSTRRNSIISIITAVVVAFGVYAYLVKNFAPSMAPVLRITDTYLSGLHRALGVNAPAPTAVPSTAGNQASTAPIVDDEQVHPHSAPRAAPPKVKAAPTRERRPGQKEIMFISSQPSGAEIYINGQNSGLLTPSRVEVPPGGFDLTLKRSGYIDYQTRQLSKSRVGHKFTATLQKAMVGYLDIDVRPAKNAKIYINEVLIKGELLPLYRYAVPAETKLKIKAVNPYTGVSTQKTVRLKQDQHSSVLLDLVEAARIKSRRSPSKAN